MRHGRPPPSGRPALWFHDDRTPRASRARAGVGPLSRICGAEQRSCAGEVRSEAQDRREAPMRRPVQGRSERHRSRPAERAAQGTRTAGPGAAAVRQRPHPRPCALVFTSGDPMTARGMTKGLTSYGDAEFSLFLRKAFVKAMGLSDDALARPIVGIANTFSDYNACHGNVPQIVDAIKRGVMLAGALPMEFPTISIHESFAYPTSMFLRNLMAM